MNQQGLNVYLNLIQGLLDCPKGEEWALLKQKEELVNPEFLRVMEQVTSELSEEGNLSAARFLQHWSTQIEYVLAQAVHPKSSKDKSQAYLQLIQALVGCPQGSEAKILAANQELIDPGLVHMTKQVATEAAAQGDQETASFLHNLAVELSRTMSQANASRPNLEPGEQKVDFTPKAQSEQLEQPQEPLAKADLTDSTPVASSEAVPLEAALSHPDTSTNQRIDDRLAAIAESFAKLSEILASRLQSSNPLWYMDVLERAQTSHWVLTTKEVEQLIGEEPRCSVGENSYRRGCWVFVKVENTDAQTEWRVVKETVEFSLA